MAVVMPLTATRYRFGEEHRPENICCPPYDVIPDQERAFWEERDPYNIIRLEKPDGPDPYAQAAALLQTWCGAGVLKRDTASAFYLYAQDYRTAEGEELTVTGIFGLTRIEEYENGVVLPHENTLAGAKKDRYDLVRATNCQLSPIYCLYEDPDRRISSIVEAGCRKKPALAFTMPDGVTHRLWRVDDPARLSGISSGFVGRKLFIADGHHRYETSLRVRDAMRAEGQASPGDPADYVMMLLTDMACPGLRVFPTHRLVRGLPNFDARALLSRLEAQFTSAPLPDDAGMLEAGTLGFVTGDGATLLTLRDREAVCERLPAHARSYCGLDVTMLHSLILEPLLGIDADNMARGENLVYTRDRAEAFRQVREGEAQCAFLLPPTAVEQIRDVSLDGEKMPQKSTYFYPKLITGLVMHSLI